MTIMDIIRKAFLEGYATSDLNITTMLVCACITAVIALYICVIYKMVNRNAFYDRSFQLALFGLSIITSMVILTIQSNIVISLGMVGALSIVRFRTAIKNPMDLVFLFWSISVGIICGAGFAMISVIGSIVLTIGIVVFGILPGETESMILVVNSGSYNEEEILNAVSQNCRSWKVRARNVGHSNVNLAVEVRTKDPRSLIESVSGIGDVTSVSLVEHDGDVTA